MGAAIVLERNGDVATIVLNRPERLNAFSLGMAEEWVDVTAQVVTDASVSAVILSGIGRSFCAGGDLRAMQESGATASDITRLAATVNKGIENLIHSAVPIVAAVHGAVAGAGLGIVLTSDYVVMAESAKVGSLYANVGMTPDAAVSALLGRAVGERRALQLLLQDRLLNAHEARDWGLAAETVPDDELQCRVTQIARSWSEGASVAYGQAKRLMRAQVGRSFAAQLTDEATTIGSIYESSSTQERISAFLGKTPPQSREA